MNWYEFSQNNSGGSFDTDYGYIVYIQATSAKDANDRAEELGLYFNGCEDGRDCPCCGDRWYRTYQESSIDNLDRAIFNASEWARFDDWKDGKMFQIVYADGRQEWRVRTNF